MADSCLCHLVVGELQMLTTLMRKFHRWNSGSQSGGEALMSLLQEARWNIPETDDQLNVVAAFTPFLEVIRSPDTSGPVTCLALMCILKLLNSDVVDPELRPSAPQALIEVVNSVIDCRFEPTDIERDEIVISKMLQVLLAALNCKSGNYIPDDSVYLIFKQCFDVHLTMRPPEYSDLLCNFAESTLGEIVKIVFSRLKTGADPAICDYDGHNIVGYSLPCIVKIFSTIPTLAYATSKHVDDGTGGQQVHQTLLALQILLVALEEPGAAIMTVGPLMNILCDEVCFFVLKQAESNNALVFTLCYRFFHLCILHYRSNMKLHLQALYNAFYLRPLALKPDQNRFIRELCLESLIDLTKHKWFFREFYINYDSDIHCEDIVKQTIQLLSQSTLPGTARLKRSNLLCLHCLRCVLSTFSPVDAWSATEYTHLAQVDELRLQAQFKKRLNTVIEEFNKKPKKGIALAQEMGILPHEDDDEFVPQVLELLQTSPNIDGLKVGEFFGGGKEEDDEVLRQIRFTWLRERYNFSRYKLEPAFRMFLEDFQLPLETQQIDRILEAFATVYCQENPSWNYSEGATYILVYSMVMIHTSFYNANVKDKLSLDTFCSMNRELIRDEKLPREALEEIYEALQAKEIEKNDGKATKMTKGSWEYLQKRNTEEWANRFYTITPDTLSFLELDADVLDLIWDPSIVALSVVFSHIQTAQAIDNVIDGFRHLCIIINFQGRTDLMDKVIKRLCELSGLLDLTNENSIFFGSSEPKQAALGLAFDVAQAYGDCIRELGWDSLVRCILRAACLQILPQNMCQLDDFAGDRRRSRSLLKKAEIPKTSSYNGIFSYFMDDTQEEEREQDEHFMTRAKEVIEETNVNLLRNSKELRESALRAFVDSIINHASFGVLNFEKAQTGLDPETGLDYIQQGCFLVQMLSGVALHNWERSEVILPRITQFLQTLVTFKAVPEFFTDHNVEPMIESGSVAIMKLCVRVIRLPYRESTDLLLSTMELLSLMTIPHYTAVDYQLVAAFHHLIRRLRECKFREDWCHAMRWDIIFDVIAKESSSKATFSTMMQILELVVGSELILIKPGSVACRSFLRTLHRFFDQPHCTVDDKAHILRIHGRLVNQLAHSQQWAEDSPNWDERRHMMEFLLDMCVCDTHNLRLEALSNFRLLIIHPSFKAFTFPSIAREDIKSVILVLEGMVSRKGSQITTSRIKIANLLCKVFALSLETLKATEGFHTICVDVFNAIEKLYLQQDDPKYGTLSESIREFVINMINIMNEAQVFSKETNPNFAEELWTLTRTYGEHIIPNFAEMFNLGDQPALVEDDAVPEQGEGKAVARLEEAEQTQDNGISSQEVEEQLDSKDQTQIARQEDDEQPEAKEQTQPPVNIVAKAVNIPPEKTEIQESAQTQESAI